MFYLAWQQILSKKRQSLLILLGISFGTMIYIIVAGLQLGMRAYMVEQLLNNTAHILISGQEKYIDAAEVTQKFFADQRVQWTVPPSGKREESKLKNPQGWFNFLDQNSYVMAYAPRYAIQAIASNAQFKNTVSLIGIIPHKQIKVTSMEDYMVQGSLNDIRGGSNTIILSSNVMKELGVKFGQTIYLSNGIYAALPFKIVGQIHFGNEQLDNSFALSHIKDVQKLDQNPGRIQDIAVSLIDMDYAVPLATQWDLMARDKVESWQEANAQFMELIQVQDLFRYIITVTVLLVAGFGIYNVLSILISQKQKEIAILKSMGYSATKILELFFIQGLFFGAMGGVIGIGLGFGMCQMIGHIEFSFDIGTSNTLWISYDPLIYLIGFLGAFCSSIVAGLIPSYHASRLTPLEIIRANT